MSEPPPQGAPIGGGDFRLFLTRLGIQGLLSLGLVENPVTGKKELNLDQARMLVGDLSMLREKTAGNLDEEEGRALAKVLGELQEQLLQHEGSGSQPES